MLKICSVKAEPLALNKLQLNFRDKVMVLPWKMCHGPASLSEHLGEVWGMLEIVPKSLWFCKTVSRAGYNWKMEVHWLQPRSSRHSSWSSHAAIGLVPVDPWEVEPALPCRERWKHSNPCDSLARDFKYYPVLSTGFEIEILHEIGNITNPPLSNAFFMSVWKKF